VETSCWFESGQGHQFNYVDIMSIYRLFIGHLPGRCSLQNLLDD